MDQDLASKISSTQKFYLDNFYHFSRDICGYCDLQPVPHLSVADFLVNTPGNGSKRISNSNYPFKVRHLNIKAEMRRVDDMPAEMRDAIALKGISNRLRQSGKFSEAQIPRIAQSILLKSRGKHA